MGEKRALWALCLCLAVGFSKAVKLGGICSDSLKCEVANSFCNNLNVCECQTDSYISVDGVMDKCFPVVNDFDQICEVSAQCKLEHTTCNGEEGLGYKCNCVEGHVRNKDKTGCLKVAQSLEESCEENEQCRFVLNAECNKGAKECRCLATHVPDGDVRCLIRKEKLEDDCDIPLQCSVPGADCIFKKCKCDEEHITHDAKCLPYLSNIQISTCVITEQCPDNSHCGFNGGGVKNCLCDAGFVKNSGWNACLKMSEKVGDLCHENSQCTSIPNTVCASRGGSSKFCTCKSNFVTSADCTSCLDVSALLGSTCEIDPQCAVKNSVCSADKKCTCDADFVPNGNNECLRRVDLSGVCEFNTQCPENSVCYTKEGDASICICDAGFITNRAGTKCLQMKDTVGGVCEEDLQCLVKNTECLRAEWGVKICTCPAVGHVTNSAFTVCEKKATQIGSVCSISEQCDAINGWCFGAFSRQNCICKPGTKANSRNNYCMPETLSGPCQENSDCAPWSDSSCKGRLGDKKCTCNADFVQNPAKNLCLPETKNLNQECVTTEQCTVPNSDCLGEDGSKTCQCNPDFVADNVNNKCLKKAEKLKDPCEVKAQCVDLPPESFCNFGYDECRCDSLHVESSDLLRCLKKTSVGGECEESTQCKATMDCLPGGSGTDVCTCKGGYVSNDLGNDCVKIAPELGFRCEVDTQCLWDNSECFGPSGSLKVCACKDGFVDGESKQECLKKATVIGGECQESAQCTKVFPNSNCIDGACTCLGYFEPTPENTECKLIPVNIGETCAPVDPKCDVVGSMCNDADKCECMSGYTASGDMRQCRQEMLGGVCLQTTQCAMASSTCTGLQGNRKCSCKSDFVSSGDSKVCLKVAASFTDNCKENDQCKNLISTECKGADEASKTCTCMSGFVLNGAGTTCIKSAEALGDECVATDPLTCSAIPEAECNTESKCACKDKFVGSIDLTKCLPVATETDSKCEEDKQCSTPFANSVCDVTKICKCATDYVSSDLKNECLKVLTNFNDVCKETSQCSKLPNSECKGSAGDMKCVCNSGFIFNTAKDTCLKKTELIGGECTAENPQVCMNNAECKNSKCECSANFIGSRDDTTCLALATSTESECQESQQCSNPIPNTVCDNKKCKCDNMYVSSSNLLKCLEVLVDFDKVCEETSQCRNLANSACEGTAGAKKCICTSGFILNVAKTACIKTEIIGGTCTTADPQVCTVENAACINSTCACKTDFVASMNSKKCLKVSGDKLGDVCEESQQCTPKIVNSECPASKKCSCKTTHVADKDSKSCLLSVDYNQTCTENQQCNAMTPGAECLIQKCSCKTANHFTAEKCWKDVKLGETCANKEECILADGLVDRVECKDAECTCLAAFTGDVDENKCNSGVANTIAILTLAMAAVFAKLF